MMALEICLQLSTVGTARSAVAAAPYCTGPFNITTCKAVKKHNYSTLSLSFPSSYQTSRKPRIVCQAQEAVDIVQEVTDKNWDSLVLMSGNPVLVEFWAPWCGPCKIIEPVIRQLAKEYAGKVSCLKLNTDAAPSIATQYGIRSIPTVLFFKNGERKESIIGAVPKSTLSSALDKYIDN